MEMQTTKTSQANLKKKKEYFYAITYHDLL